MKREEEVPILDDTTIAEIAKKYSIPNTENGSETPTSPAQIFFGLGRIGSRYLRYPRWAEREFAGGSDGIEKG